MSCSVQALKNRDTRFHGMTRCAVLAMPGLENRTTAYWFPMFNDIVVALAPARRRPAIDMLRCF